MTTSDALIHARGLTKRFGGFTAVDGIDFDVAPGEAFGFLGPNGAGKTTTMQMLTGNLAPSSGSIRICGIDLIESPTAAKAHIGYLPETPPLYRELTVREYIDLAARLHRVPKSERHAAVDAAMAGCGLTGVAKKLVGTLSKGYQQRVGIAQAIVHKPDIVILDEPTVGLDPNQIRDIRNLIRELGRERSVILSTHILPEVEAICDRVQIMHHGKMVYADTIAGLKQLHSGRTLLVGLTQPPALDELRTALLQVTGVQEIDAAGDKLFRVHTAAATDPTEGIVALASTHHWGLRQIGPAQTSLEEVFVNLTQAEAQP